MGHILERLIRGETPTLTEMTHFLSEIDDEKRQEIYAASAEIRRHHFGNRVLFRGLIEFTSFCRNDCHYCGIRRGNTLAERYRLSKEQILECCYTGHELGFRSFVLQGGEDPWFTDERICDIISAIHRLFPDSALTISFGEQTAESYRRYFEAGADRYLLRHETADPLHYALLHPRELSLENRMRCLQELKGTGYQVGAGFMVGAPGQTLTTLAKDLLFLKTFQPHMIGIGPFIPHSETIFANKPAGSVQQTLDMIALTRIMVPRALLPATTALGSIDPTGREKALAIGANVIMPNLSPSDVRKMYAIYNDKLSTGKEAAESLENNKRLLIAAGFEPDMSRGDWGDAENSL